MAYCLWLKELVNTVYLILLSTQSSCCGDLLQLRRRLFPEDLLQQDKDVCRLRRSLQQHCQTTIPKRARAFWSTVIQIFFNKPKILSFIPAGEACLFLVVQCY